METKRLSDRELVREHQADVWRYLRFLGCDRSMADDLTQETFLAVIRKPFQQRSRSETAAYLRTVARRQMLMAVRARRRSVSLDALESAEQVWADATGGAFDDYLLSLEDCLAALTERARQAIHLRYEKNASREDMATQLDLSCDGVKSLLRRVRSTLRDCITKRMRN